jgi:hypothetical protein
MPGDRLGQRRYRCTTVHAGGGEAAAWPRGGKGLGALGTARPIWRAPVMVRFSTLDDPPAAGAPFGRRIRPAKRAPLHPRLSQRTHSESSYELRRRVESGSATTGAVRGRRPARSRLVRSRVGVGQRQTRLNREVVGSSNDSRRRCSMRAARLRPLLQPRGSRDHGAAGRAGESHEHHRPLRASLGRWSFAVRGGCSGCSAAGSRSLPQW